MNNSSERIRSSAPETLDGAKVLFTAPAVEGQIGHNCSTGEPVAISYFASALYCEHEPRVYLFGVSSTHEVVSDFVYESPDDAMRVARDSGFTHHDFQPKFA